MDGSPCPAGVEIIFRKEKARVKKLLTARVNSWPLEDGGESSGTDGTGHRSASGEAASVVGAGAASGSGVHSVASVSGTGTSTVASSPAVILSEPKRLRAMNIT